jgi:hypothetical protein
MQISRTVAVVALSLSMGGAAQAAGDSAAVTDTYVQLYDLSMICFVANGHAAGRQARSGNPSGAAYFKGKGKEAFDLASRAGQHLGYSVQRVGDDFDAAQQRELPLIVRDEGYFRQVSGRCKALGLM